MPRAVLVSIWLAVLAGCVGAPIKQVAPSEPETDTIRVKSLDQARTEALDAQRLLDEYNAAAKADLAALAADSPASQPATRPATGPASTEPATQPGSTEPTSQPASRPAEEPATQPVVP